MVAPVQIHRCMEARPEVSKPELLEIQPSSEPKQTISRNISVRCVLMDLVTSCLAAVASSVMTAGESQVIFLVQLKNLLSAFSAVRLEIKFMTSETKIN